MKVVVSNMFCIVHDSVPECEEDSESEMSEIRGEYLYVVL